jgi:hypothetical protein
LSIGGAGWIERRFLARAPWPHWLGLAGMAPFFTQ